MCTHKLSMYDYKLCMYANKLHMYDCKLYMYAHGLSTYDNKLCMNVCTITSLCMHASEHINVCM